MQPFRFLALVAKAIPFPSSPRRCFRFFSSLATNPRFFNSFDDDVESGSAVYRHALKFQRPRIINWSSQLENAVSLIGSVTGELRFVKTKTGKFGVYTFLDVRTSHESNCSSFSVLLMMWNGMAEIASKHLKANDFIYVSGFLDSYSKEDWNGNLRSHYKVIVKNLDFVAQGPANQGRKKSKPSEGGGGIQNNKNRLYLWQVFFANPYEWWDNRKRKVNPKQPDFKHKDTGEVLWLSQRDPPWVKRQLQLLDSKIAEGGLVRPRSRVTTWVYDE
ncbi:hypothetical protein L6164_024696 [Bauhinia variegata]|uniref:Uncharacterized protein n=1 Tax=Bauhinia variegata TaxID=167791 RepID=A0ACB9LYL1_BAUVA|nr:hypothetical protein L6164_024696 [Bauhinia variegata]